MQTQNTLKANFAIRPLSLEDLEAWSELLALTFDRSISQMSQMLKWLSSQYPILAYGAWDSERGKLAAQYACLSVNLQLPGNGLPVKVGMSLNMSVHPDYRGLGLIKQVSKPVYEAVIGEGGIAGVGFSNAEGVKVDQKSKGYGYQVVGQMRSMIAIFKPSRVDRARFKLCDSWADLGNLQTTWSDRIAFHVTEQTIAHRYQHHPFRTYRYGIWYDGHQVNGIVVYRYANFSGITTLLAAYSHDLRGLLYHWAGAMQAEGRYLTHVLLTPHSPIRHALKQIAICTPIPTRHPYYLTVKLLTPLAETLLEFNHWHCIGGDIL
ncbi:MAG: GNAT family N-acetyltransferase [Anaerolineae bacterium]|nr:GNAT family N-acetyltransferase [Anaerolineae bacterium]